nr:immunoglobulin light chain junction region [Macaca mulatta]MPO00162.1 immunoglobulin light chain junction region [Macaca mulatta]
CQHYDSTPYTF